jgi:hypothetical protein
MKRVHLVVLGIVAITVLAACRSSVLPASNSASFASAAVQKDGGCRAPRALSLIVCIDVPQSGIAKLVVTDSVYGYGFVPQRKVIINPPHGCTSVSGGYACAASFDSVPAQTLNQIQIDAYSSSQEVASAAFPVEAGKTEVPPQFAIVDGPGAISALSVTPFHSTSTNPGTTSSLPLGQDEHVWIVAKDSQGRVIVGDYQPSVTVNETPSGLGFSCGPPCSLSDSAQAEAFDVYWHSKFGVKGNPVSLTAQFGSNTASAPVYPGSGVAYFQAPPNQVGLGGGPVAINPVTNDVYFAVNDDRDTGCQTPGTCQTLLERFHPSEKRHAFDPPLALSDVPGVSQLYFTSDGALWIATFQPVGSWNYPLPAYRLPPNDFSESALQPLPTSTYGEPSGFVEDSSNNLWISSCEKTHCKQYRKGTPVLFEASLTAYGKPRAIPLPMQCTQFGYGGYSVGDVGFYPPNGGVYVLGLSEGSAPPARGTLWGYSSAENKASCHQVPSDFNPSPYFTLVAGADGKLPALVFGVGGNPANFRWNPGVGFYLLSGAPKAKLVQVGGTPHHTILVTPNHVSAFGTDANPGKVMYYIASSRIHQRFSGLGTFAPSANDAWGVFPSGAFAGDQLNDGVAAAADGAWFTANGVCGSNYNGVCLAHAIIIPKASAWGVLPGLYLPPLSLGSTVNFGVIAQSDGSDPLVLHSGPFYAHVDPSPNPSCTVQKVANLTFSVTGGGTPGVCQIIITRGPHAPVGQPIVTVVK